MRYFLGEQKRRARYRLMMRMLMVLLGVGLMFSRTYAAPPHLSIERSDPWGSLVLWRYQGESLAVRHRLLSVASKAKPQTTFETEITHLTSGCALKLSWSRGSIPQGHVPLDLSQSLTFPRKVRRSLAQRFAQSRWGKLGPSARGVQFSLKIPAKAQLDEVIWWGCGWGATLEESTAQSPSSKSRATLPKGAVSTRAISPFSFRNKARREHSLGLSMDEAQMKLESARWAFALVVEASTQQIKLRRSVQEPYHYMWSDSTQSGRETTSKKTEMISLNVRLFHASPKLTPLKRGAPRIKGDEALSEWSTLLDFLSSAEGVVDGLGRRGTTRQWAGLAMLSALDTRQFSQLSTEWCEATLLGALQDLPAWPNPFRAYKRPLKPFDGRLFFPIALARYLLDHPAGKKRTAKLLKRTWSGQMIGGIMRRHLQDLIGRGAFFANRPSKRHLIAVHTDPTQIKPGETLRYGYLESVILMPRALKAIERLLSEPDLRALMSAPIGLELRASKIHTRWREKTREFFGRQLEVYEARSRVENWGRYLGIENPQIPALNIRYNLKYYEESLNDDPPSLSGFNGLDLLWGQHNKDELSRLINLARPFPAGLVTSSGMLARQSLPFMQQLSPQSETLLTPTASVSALWILGLNRQLRRRWPFKIKAQLEDARAAIWTRITSSPRVPTQSISVDNTSSTPQTTERGDPASTKGQSERSRSYQTDPWFSDHLSALDSLLASLKAPPAIQPATGVDVRELR